MEIVRALRDALIHNIFRKKSRRSFRAPTFLQSIQAKIYCNCPFSGGLTPAFVDQSAVRVINQANVSPLLNGRLLLIKWTVVILLKNRFVCLIFICDLSFH